MNNRYAGDNIDSSPLSARIIALARCSETQKLFVDDDELERGLLADMLQSYGLQVPPRAQKHYYAYRTVPAIGL